MAEHNDVNMIEKNIENVVALKMSIDSYELCQWFTLYNLRGRCVHSIELLRLSKSGAPHCRLTLTNVQLPYLTDSVLSFILSKLLDIPSIWNSAIESFPTVFLLSCVIFSGAKFGCAVSKWSFWRTFAIVVLAIFTAIHMNNIVIKLPLHIIKNSHQICFICCSFFYINVGHALYGLHFNQSINGLHLNTCWTMYV